MYFRHQRCCICNCPRHKGYRYRAIEAALLATTHVDRVIHLRTQYLGPEEMLVGAKIALAPGTDLATVAAAIDAAEAAVRAAVPAADIIYLEPDLDRSAVR